MGAAAGEKVPGELIIDAFDRESLGVFEANGMAHVPVLSAVIQLNLNRPVVVLGAVNGRKQGTTGQKVSHHKQDKQAFFHSNLP
ncbi:hypothetical protein J31TS4_21880 [Paenibacillus sp. J31TS4]|nr:hypothetical protein J31TS4_21880 [Paenibacillus sp. J31TS4]